MSNKTDFVFKALHVIAWVIFVGLSIEAGALIVNFIISLYNPTFVKNLYTKLDLTQLYQQNRWVFFGLYAQIMAVAILKAHLFYLVIELLNKLDLANPFTSTVARKISNISYYTFAIGIISYIARENAKRMEHYNFDTSILNEYWTDSQSFVLMSAVIYVIAAIFKRGIEIQEENDLTV
jgi:hypothetical protein